MRKILVFPVFLLAAIAASALAPSSVDAAEVPEICAKAERKPMGKIVLRSITHNGAKGVRACAYVGATTDQTYAALTDYASFPKWIDKVDKIDVTWTDAKVAMVTYTLGTLFGDYKYTLRRVHQAPWHVQWSRVSGDFKVVDGAYTFLSIEGTSDSYMIVETTVDPGVSMPSFIENYFREKGSRQLVEDIRTEVMRRQKK